MEELGIRQKGVSRGEKVWGREGWPNEMDIIILYICRITQLVLPCIMYGQRNEKLCSICLQCVKIYSTVMYNIRTN